MIVCFQMVPFLQPAYNLSLFRAIQTPADPTPPPHLGLQRGNPKEEVPTPSPGSSTLLMT